MSIMLTMQAPAPNWAMEANWQQIVADENGLIQDVPAGSEVAKALISYGCTVVAAAPTVDPHVSGAIWNHNGTLVLSAG